MTERLGKDLRIAVISALARRSKCALGRTALMKLAYFLQVLREVPLGYSFRLYTYGPYDPQVLDDLKVAEMIGAVRSEVFHYPGGYGYQISPGDRAEGVIASSSQELAKYEDNLNEMIEKFSTRTAIELEMASTIVYVDRSCASTAENIAAEDITKRVQEIKPHLDARAIEAEVRDLGRNGALRSLQH